MTKLVNLTDLSKPVHSLHSQSVTLYLYVYVCPLVLNRKKFAHFYGT